MISCLMLSGPVLIPICAASRRPRYGGLPPAESGPETDDDASASHHAQVSKLTHQAALANLEVEQLRGALARAAGSDRLPPPLPAGEPHAADPYSVAHDSAQRRGYASLTLRKSHLQSTRFPSRAQQPVRVTPLACPQTATNARQTTSMNLTPRRMATQRTQRSRTVE